VVGSLDFNSRWTRTGTRRTHPTTDPGRQTGSPRTCPVLRRER